MSDVGCSLLGAGAWGWPREMLWGGRWEGGSCLGTHVRIKDFKIYEIKKKKISQEAGQVVWYSHLIQNFPQFIVIHRVKGYGIVNKAEIDVFFWSSLAFSMIQWMLAIWSLVPLPFLKPAWTSGSSRFTYCWSLAWRILSITLLACEISVS